MDIMEGNRMIHIWMGKSYQTDKKDNSNNLKYHTSLDWLMPVVEKINDICSKKATELSNHSTDQKYLPDPLGNPLHWKSWSYHWIHLSTDINHVWNKAIQFIQWYNQTKK